jgi:hypothetical protein
LVASPGNDKKSELLVDITPESLIEFGIYIPNLMP